MSDVIYLGQMVRYHLAGRDGRTIVAVASDRGGGARVAAGMPVRLTWRPEDVWIIPADDRGADTG